MRRDKIHGLSKEQLEVYREDLRTQIIMLNNYEDISSEFPYLSKTEDDNDFPFKELLRALPSLGNVMKTFNPKVLKVLEDTELRDFICTLPSFLLIPVTEIGEPDSESFASVDQVIFADTEFLWIRIVEIDNVIDIVLMKSEEDFRLLKVLKEND